MRQKILVKKGENVCTCGFVVIIRLGFNRLMQLLNTLAEIWKKQTGNELDIVTIKTSVKWKSCKVETI